MFGDEARSWPGRPPPGPRSTVGRPATCASDQPLDRPDRGSSLSCPRQSQSERPEVRVAVPTVPTVVVQPHATSAADASGAERLTVTVTVATWANARWDVLCSAIAGIWAQTCPPDALIVVVDHNDVVLARARAQFAGPSTRVVASTGAQGVSGSRNTAVDLTDTDLVAFLDDDAVPEPTWLEHLVEQFAEPSVMIAGGWAEPVWETERPPWWPPDFDWVVGCSYQGQPTVATDVRNPLGCSMLIRRSVFERVGPFSSELGRVGAKPVGADETELCVRLSRADPAARVRWVPESRVRHHVTAQRATLAYFLARCEAEGRSKAALTAMVAGTRLATESTYARELVTRRVGQELGAGRPRRAAAILGGLVVTGVSYAAGAAPRPGRGHGRHPSPPGGPSDTARAAGLWCGEFELSGGGGPRAAAPADAGQRTARVLVRLHGEPLGYVVVARSAGGSPERIDTDELVRLSWSSFPGRIRQHLAAESADGDGAGRPAAATGSCPNQVVSDVRVSVVVCTRNRAERLTGCLTSLVALSPAPVEVVVVDNAPRDDSTRLVVESIARDHPGVRYVVEPRPGLSRARNRGLSEATGQFVAYTDDDCRVDPGWVGGVLRGLHRRPDVGCVTGLACTADITGAAEAYFDARASSWSTRCDPDLFELPTPVDRGPLFPYSAGIYGTGASFAVDRALLLASGGFDEALGAGTATRGGEDLDAFVRVLRAGRSIAYEPSAMVWHHHRADPASLREQMYGYGTGLTAFLAKLVRQRDTRNDIARRVPQGLALLAGTTSATRARLGSAVQAPRGVVLRERAGLVTGPALYAWSSRASRPRTPRR